MDSITPVVLDPRAAPAAPGVLRSRALRIAVVALPLVFGSSRALASFEVLEPIDTVVHHARAVVLGHVVATSSHWERGTIVTDAIVDVSATFKGRAPHEVVVREPGGRVAGIAARVDGVPVFRVGEEAVLFLVQHGAAADAHFHVVDGLAGKIDVARDAAGHATVVWWEPEIDRIERTSLGELADHVQRVAQEEAR